jgi:hypothetical protein
MAQTLPAPFAYVRSIVESAPASIRPLLYHAGACFLKREEPRWNTLTPHLTEERFLNFLECPSSWDLVREHLAEEYPLLYKCDVRMGGPSQDWADHLKQTYGFKSAKDIGKDKMGWFVIRLVGSVASFHKALKAGDLHEDDYDSITSLNEDGGGAATGGAPANAAGNGGVAGIGQPPGSYFGEPPGRSPLGGATTKTKKKNKKPEDLEEDRDDHEGDEKVKCFECNGTGRDYGETCVTCGGAGEYWVNKKTGRFSDYALDEELAKADIEKAAAEVHDRWMDNQKKSGHTEHKSPDGKEDYMVPYEKLKEKSKQLDRDAVEATVDALGLDEERETFAGGDVFEVDTDRWMKSRFGKNRYHRYSRYVGSDKVGEEIRQHGRGTKRDIILKDQQTGVMTWLTRRKKPGTL